MTIGLLSSPGLTARILIVDDDDYVREVTEMVLAEAGHSVRSTANGYEALRWLEEQPCDLLILDLRMPEIDGPTLYREILARWPTGGPHVLFTSGLAESTRDGAAGTQDVPLLFKPFTLDALRDAVGRVLTTV